MRNSVVFVMLIQFLAVLAYGQAASPERPAQSSVFRIVVRDPSGALVPKGFLLIRAHSDSDSEDHSVPFRVELHTDKHGKAQTLLAPGFYDLFVTASGDVLAPYSDKILVQQGKPFEISVVLKFDRFHGDCCGEGTGVETVPSEIRY